MVNSAVFSTRAVEQQEVLSVAHGVYLKGDHHEDRRFGIRVTAVLPQKNPSGGLAACRQSAPLLLAVTHHEHM